MRWELHVESGQHAGKRIHIATRFLIGRDDACDLQPVSVLVSRRHCVILPEVDHLFVIDCHSTNGTFVNDRRICPELPVELSPGDQLRVGPLHFVIVSVAPAPDEPDDLSVAEMLLEMDRLEQAEEEATSEGTAQHGSATVAASLADETRTRRQAERSSSSVAAENVLRACLGSASTPLSRR